MSRIAEKIDGLLTQIHAPLPSTNENEDEEDMDLPMDIPPIPNVHAPQNEISEEEEEEEEKVHYFINKPPPKQDKKLKIQMRKTQTFGSIIPPLQNRFGKKITLSFDGEEIQNEWTPQYLIDEFEIEEGDMIDAHYG